MVEVTIADILQKQPLGNCVAVLLDGQRRALPVWIGQAEAMAIAIELTGFPVARPLTVRFIASTLEAFEVELESVRIETLDEHTYRAHVRLTAGDRVREIDARPGDALALAQRLRRPIFVAEAIMAGQGIVIRQTLTEVARHLGGDLTSLTRAFTLE
jgi:bifunctional DNase/RNase